MERWTVMGAFYFTLNVVTTIGERSIAVNAFASSLISDPSSWPIVLAYGLLFKMRPKGKQAFLMNFLKSMDEL